MFHVKHSFFIIGFSRLSVAEFCILKNGGVRNKKNTCYAGVIVNAYSTKITFPFRHDRVVQAIYYITKGKVILWLTRRIAWHIRNGCASTTVSLSQI